MSYFDSPPKKPRRPAKPREFNKENIELMSISCNELTASDIMSILNLDINPEDIDVRISGDAYTKNQQIIFSYNVFLKNIDFEKQLLLYEQKLETYKTDYENWKIAHNGWFKQTMLQYILQADIKTHTLEAVSEHLHLLDVV